MTNTIRVAAYQMATTADIQVNLEKMLCGIREAAAQGAAVVAFPECAVSGYSPACHKDTSEIDLTALTAAHNTLTTAAQQARIWVIAGTILEDNGALFNSALIIGPDGAIRGTYDKLHLYKSDKRFFKAGNCLPLFDMDGIPFGIQICYDVRFPEPFRLLKEAGASIIFNLSDGCGAETWKIQVLEGVYRARASENCLYVVAVNSTGPQQITISQIVDVDGLTLTVAGQNTDELIVADLDLSRIAPGHFGNRRTDLFELQLKNGK